MFLAIRRDGSILAKGDILYNGRNDAWTFQSVTHPRKVFVTDKADPNGPDSWPNLSSREFYADVLNVGIWDTEYKDWSFFPSWPKTITNAITKTLKAQA